MKECIRRARRLGAACLNLHTTDMMQVAMRMYERMGFVRAPDWISIQTRASPSRPIVLNSKLGDSVISDPAGEAFGLRQPKMRKYDTLSRICILEN